MKFLTKFRTIGLFFLFIITLPQQANSTGILVDFDQRPSQTSPFHQRLPSTATPFIFGLGLISLAKLGKNIKNGNHQPPQIGQQNMHPQVAQ